MPTPPVAAPAVLRVATRVHPGARHPRVSLGTDGRLEVWLPARAVDNAANDALPRVVAQALGLRARQVRLVQGLASRSKVLEIDLPDRAALNERLAAPARARASASTSTNADADMSSVGLEAGT